MKHTRVRVRRCTCEAYPFCKHASNATPQQRSFREYLDRKAREYGAKFDPSQLPSKFIRYYENGKRIEVLHGEERLRGTVGITTGWCPAFLLKLRRNSTGSSILLSEDYQIMREIN